MRRGGGGLRRVLSDLCGQSWWRVRRLEVLFRKKNREENQARKPSGRSGLGLCLIYYRDEGLLQNVQVCAGHLGDTGEVHGICSRFKKKV